MMMTVRVKVRWMMRRIEYIDSWFAAKNLIFGFRIERINSGVGDDNR